MGTAERRQRERERKEREIIDAARELFFMKGYDSTSVDEIAARLEIAKGSVYLYFSNKEELFYAVANDGMRIALQMYEEAVKEARTGLDKLMAIGRAYIRFWSSHPGYRRLLHENAFKSPLGGSGPRGKEMARTGAATNELMVAVIRQGMQDGSIRSDVDPEKLAFAASSMVDGMLQRMERRQASEEVREQMLSYAFELVRAAVAVAPVVSEVTATGSKR